MGDKSKLRRVLNKAEPIIKNGGFVFLQETHLKDIGYLKIVWKYGFVSNCKSSNSAGVLTLYNNNYNVLEQHEDGEGRQMVTVVGQEESKYILTNAYFPNDHKASIEFTENLYNKTLESQNAYPEAITIMAGDLNMCLKINDSLNRLKSQNEKILSENILCNNRVLQLADAYRSLHSEVESNECERCNIEETTKHLLWECVHANNIWSIFNVIMSKIGRNTDSVGNYDNIYDIPASPAIVIVKLKIIQEMVQVVRPKMWNMSKMINLIRDLKNIESYNAKINRMVNKFNNKWSIFENILKQ